MKVVYKKTIFDRLLEEKYEAERKGKTIDYFLLTPGEWNELRSDRHVQSALQSSCYSWRPDAVPTAVSYSYVDLQHKHDRYMTKRFLISDWTVLGERIVVAPSEYH